MKSKYTISCEQKSSHYLLPFQRQHLLNNLATDLRPEHRLRIEIMLLADCGESQSKICKILGCSQDTARYWIGMLQTDASHKWNEQPIGRPKIIDEQYLSRLKELASYSPRDFGYSFQQWTAQWLSKHLTKEFGIQISDRYINKLLKQMGLSTRKNKTV